ncbi:YveK family protein [Halanaerobium salsuginis]|uniref:Chain length determinant protein n=1 Tax=Halanaerobium salsuginis TaxID=29563 RepID=A0A1I4N7A9_9FIRM|nr:Wzz/FepE/Etk N-terminal domain-containing protein [Halanaerobium salsuginis]SFM11379.1 Chain length determinant protein [Halanaerobium salsuginis]
MESQINSGNNRQYYDEYEIDLREYIILLWQKKWLILGLVVLAILAAFLINLFVLPTTYQTRAKIQLTEYPGIYGQSNYARQFLQSSELIKQAAARAGLELTSQEINYYQENRLMVTLIPETKIIELQVEASEPQLAYDLTNNIISIFSQQSADYYKSLLASQQRYVEELEGELKSINRKIAQDQHLNSTKDLEANQLLLNSFLNESNSLFMVRRDLRVLIQQEKEKLLSYAQVRVIDEPYLPVTKKTPNLGSLTNVVKSK